MGAMAGDGEIKGFREPRDFHEGGYASAVGDIRFGVRDSRIGNIVFELPERAQVLSGRDRHAAGGEYARVGKFSYSTCR